jgi:hypothetical protein
VPTLGEAVQCVYDWVRQKQILAGKRGSGRYTPAQVDLYREIETHLRNFRPVCLGTDPYPGKPEPGRQGGSGEHLSKGLAGGHAYAVLDCFEDPGGVKYVRVHNPWGRIGRGYHFAPDFMSQQPSAAAQQRWEQRINDPNIPDQRKIEQAFETDAGTFWLELSDLTKRCHALYACTETPAVITQGRAYAKLG